MAVLLVLVRWLHLGASRVTALLRYSTCACLVWRRKFLGSVRPILFGRCRDQWQRIGSFFRRPMFAAATIADTSIPSGGGVLHRQKGKWNSVHRLLKALKTIAMS